MSPEYALCGIFCERSDVFSFGVLILEIVSGRKNTSFNFDDQHQSLIAYVSSIIFPYKFAIFPIWIDMYFNVTDEEYYLRHGICGVKAEN